MSPGSNKLYIMKSNFFYLVLSGFMMVFLLQGNHTLSADYGYFLGTENECSLWWAEGVYKVMQQDPVPDGKIMDIELFAASNEYESAQVVIFPHQTLRNFRISIQELRSKSGQLIPVEQFSVRRVEYVEVTRPTDDYGKPGWYPDPLPLYNEPLDLEKGVNHPFYITLKVPPGTVAGDYKGTINLKADGWEKNLPLSVHIWNFQIPEDPTIRSAFGIGTEGIRQYHNLDTDVELQEVTDKYYTLLSEYRIGPTNPFSLHPMKVIVEGLNWTGGLITDEVANAGRKSLKVIDNDVESGTEAYTNSLISVDYTKSYLLTWYVKMKIPDQKYCVLLKCYDAEKQLMPFENRLDEFTGQDTWGQDTLNVRKFREEVKYVSIHLFPVFRDITGRQTGFAWFDDVSFFSPGDGENLVLQGDFEVNPEDLDISVDFTQFDKAGQKYLDELGFNAYHLPLQGLPSGNFYQQRRGVFNGFAQGTEEYDYLMKEYLSIVQDHLEEKGWLGKDYVYWFDEPNTENYSFVREGMEIIHRSAPKITRFITEHQPGPDIMDVSEISCTVIRQLDPLIIKDLVAQGREFWSYVCCCPKAPYLSLFIDHDAINMRMWLWLSYKYKMKGILVWSANYWNSRTASPENYLQNPWEDPMAYTVGYGLPYGKQNGWGNGDGRFLYPPNRNPNDHSRKYMEGPVPCLRLENIRDGIEDFEYLKLLEKFVSNSENKNRKSIKKAIKLLELPDSLVKGPVEYDKDPEALLHYRIEMGNLLNDLNGKP